MHLLLLAFVSILHFAPPETSTLHPDTKLSCVFKVTRIGMQELLLQHLEQEDFQLLLLHLQGFRNRELCEMFGLTEVVIKKRLQRTREKTLAYFQQKS